ncbi:MAG: pseudouridine synthase [Microscillaceae bacterium]|jgi:23S rRNA pseudouridine2457 synthase|nr:pseudouridine synthase [Microscillaceae bacterium]
MLRYFLIYKPYGVLNQFTDDLGRPTLASLHDFPRDVYPVGRLDLDSEGLLLLTNDKKINHLLLNPQFKHEKEYWVQVEGTITPAAIEKLRAGITIRVDKKDYFTLPAQAEILDNPQVPEREPPIRYRENIPTSWLSLAITEGKKHQVRKMTAQVGFPTLRLIRVRIEGLLRHNMQVGEVRELSQAEVYQKLGIDA